MAEEREKTGIPDVPPRRRLPVPKWLLWTAGILAGIALLLYIASFFMEEPLRRIAEEKVNRDLKGYTVRVSGLKLRLIRLSVALTGFTVIQQAHPEPPAAFFPTISAGIHWREIFSGKLVGELRLDEPRLHINLLQLRTEAASKVPLRQMGWQQALEDLWPLKINFLRINNGSLTYVDQDPKRPLVVTHLNILADNIRNIRLPDQVYPSSVHLDAVIFGTGHALIEGRANFLAEPTPALKANLKLEKIPLDYFRPQLARSNLKIAGGTLRANGHLEYAPPKVQNVQLSDLNISGMDIEYLHSEARAATEQRLAEKAGKTAKKLTNKPEVQIGVDRFSLTGCRLGLVHDTGGKSYRLFLSDTDFTLRNFSNQFSRGPATARLTGKFMGSGLTEATGDFRAEKPSPDFDLYLKITNTDLPSLNDLLRSYGKFDVAAGKFSLVTELHVKNNQVAGYIKPFFSDLKVFDRRKDREKGIFRKMYELLIGGIAKLLENKRGEVATKAEISGPLNQPHMSTWEVIVQLVRNAFIKAILPTFESQVTAAGKR